MGKVIAVDSVVYNLAGEPTGRPSYLKSLVIQNMLSSSTSSIADMIKDGYANSPAVRLKNFYRWAGVSENYGLIGRPTGRLEVSGRLPAAKVAAEIPHADGFIVKVRSAKTSYADPFYWAERYMLDNHAADYGTNWEFDYFKSSNQIRIDLVSGPNEWFVASGFDYTARYIYAYYSRVNQTTKRESDAKLFIYKIGSGNAELDELVEDRAVYGEFFPFIPVRLDNQFLSDTFKPGAYAQAKAAYKKATGAKLDELIDDLKDNESLDDIDYTYISFGTSLNTQDDAAKQYIYAFFRNLMMSQEGGPEAYSEWLEEVRSYKISLAAWDEWNYRGRIGDEPEREPNPAPTINKIRITGTGDVNTSYDVRLKWNYVKETTRTGKGKAGAKAGNLWLEAEKVSIGQERVLVTVGMDNQHFVFKDIEAIRLRIYWQKTKSEYTYLDVIGAEYENVIYKGKSVVITPIDALEDAEESGFIIPLHYDTWKSLGMVTTTQMSLASVYAVFNCYKERKTKWYESWIFRIFLVIAISIASVLFTGGAGIGLLGSHLAVGTSFGLTGITAAIVGSVVNGMAAMVLTTVISQVTSGMGAFGSILSTLLGIVVGNFASAIETGSLTFNWANLLRVDNLMKLTQSVGDTMVSLVQQDTLGIQEAWADFQENAEEKALKIQQAFFDQFGYGAGVIDPTAFTDYKEVRAEQPDSFLTRTLMTGGEIAELSQGLISNFSQYSLDLPDAFSK